MIVTVTMVVDAAWAVQATAAESAFPISMTASQVNNGTSSSAIIVSDNIANGANSSDKTDDNNANAVGVTQIAPTAVPIAPAVMGVPPIPTVIAELLPNLEVQLTLEMLPTIHCLVNGKFCLQKKYKGLSFNVPPAGATGPFYFVMMDCKVGILNTWVVFICLFVCRLILNFPRKCTAPYVIGVSHTSYSQVLFLHDGYM